MSIIKSVKPQKFLRNGISEKWIKYSATGLAGLVVVTYGNQQ